MVGRMLYFALLIVPILEIATFVAVAETIGFWPALAGVLLMSLIGAAVMRRQGFSLLNEIRATIGHGQMPARALADAMLVGIAGVLMVIPGYLTDIVGLLLLIPPLRHWSYRLLARRMGAARGANGAPSQRAPDVIELDSDHFRSP
jgi:UPF0716 protein FxsA